METIAPTRSLSTQVVGTPTRELTIGIVGAGRVGAAIGAAFARTGHKITGAPDDPMPPMPASTSLLPGTPHRRAEDVVRHADLVIFAVPDDALAPLIAHLGESGAFRPGVIVAHTSGAHGIGILHPATARGARPLALHPAMTFTGHAEDVDRLFSGISFGVTAPDDLRHVATELVGGTRWQPGMDPGRAPRALSHGSRPRCQSLGHARQRGARPAARRRRRAPGAGAQPAVACRARQHPDDGRRGSDRPGVARRRRHCRQASGHAARDRSATRYRPTWRWLGGPPIGRSPPAGCRRPTPSHCSVCSPAGRRRSSDAA